MSIQTSGSDSRPMTWPQGKRCAVCLTFDFDAESLWLASDPENAGRLATLSQGRYGAKVGVPKILEVLREEGLKGTFFTPGWTIDAHPGKVEAILRDGHELGHHGYAHHWPDPANPAQMLEEVDRGFDAMQRHFGVKPQSLLGIDVEKFGGTLNFRYGAGKGATEFHRQDATDLGRAFAHQLSRALLQSGSFGDRCRLP